MNVAQVSDRRTRSATRRPALLTALALAAAGAGLLVYAAVAGARFELVVAAVGLAAGAALVGLLVLSPGLSVTRADR